MGDPAGVGPLITWQAWSVRRSGPQPFYVLAEPEVLSAAARTLNLPSSLAIIESPDQAASVFADRLPVMPVYSPAPQAGQPDIATAPAIELSIRLAVRHVTGGQAAAIVTNPIAKSLLYKAGFQHPGHTEFLAHLASNSSGTPLPVMMLCGGGLRVALATIHRPLASVPGALSTDLIVRVGRIVAAALARDFGLDAPRIGLCGLNPHAGEDGGLGNEETDMINPAAFQLRAEGIEISNARPGDTIFHEARSGAFDAVIAMYHDQGLIPVKTLDIWGGVNVTLGLPFIRTSPDHGTAYDAAAAGKARPDSLLAALDIASAMAASRARAT
jgi:4-hydroxythreonine-4-phosphate dehydrogenase